MIELNKKQEEFLYRLIDIEKDTNRFNSYIILCSFSISIIQRYART